MNTFSRRLISAAFSILLLLSILIPSVSDAAAAPAIGTGKIVNCTSYVNVRSGPGTGYAKMGTAPKGATYPVLAKTGSWYKISFNGRTGYVSGSYMAFYAATKPAAGAVTSSQGKIVNCTSYVNVRSGPGTSYAKIGTAPKGAIYSITGKTGSWYKISFNGKTGYVYASYISVLTVASTPTKPSPTPSPTPKPAPAPTSSPVPIPTTAPVPSVPTPAPTPLPAGSDKILAGYYASWAAYSGYTPLNIPAQNLTHIYYAFANIGPDLKIAMGDAAIDPSNFAKLRQLKQQYSHLKTLISIGGWTWSGRFSDIALTDESRAAFADSVVSFIKQYGFDGVDIDWEYPVGGGLATNAVRPEDKVNFTLLMAKLREKLDAQGRLDAHRYLLTFAGAAGSFFAENAELDKLANSVDFASVMTYDMHGPWAGSNTDFNSPLFTPAGTSPQYQWSCDSAVKLWLNKGFPKDKLIMGIPFYGVRFNGVANTNYGLYQRFASGSSIPYDQIAATYLKNPSFKRYVHVDARVPWLFDGATFISYDDPASIAEKAAYIRSSGIRGAMVWELSQNADGTLLNAIRINMN